MPKCIRLVQGLLDSKLRGSLVKVSVLSACGPRLGVSLDASRQEHADLKESSRLSRSLTRVLCREHIESC